MVNVKRSTHSSGMLSAAQRKEVYQQLHQLYLGTRVDLPDAHYIEYRFLIDFRC